MHDGLPAYSHTRKAAVRSEYGAQQAQHKYTSIQSSTQAASGSKRGGDLEEAGNKMNEGEWKKKSIPAVRIPQSPEANKDLWAQV